MKQPHLGTEGPRSSVEAVNDVVSRAFRASAQVTRSAPHVRSSSGTDVLLNWFIIASLPAVIVGAWALGAELVSGVAATGESLRLPGWRGPVFGAIDPANAPGWLGGLAIGLSYFLPLLVVALVVSFFWQVVFAVQRKRPVDPGGLMTAWLFAALLPATMPLPLAALGLSFGVVLGSHVFGGTGRYLVSPALLGVLFLGVAYPELFGSERWLPGLGTAPTWTVLATADAEARAAADLSWLAVFAGRETGALGAPSAIACLTGALILVARGAASWRTIGGGLLGLTLAAVALGGADAAPSVLPWHWQLATGTFAFGLAFVATDPTTLPLTALGRWLHGGIVGLIVVLIRVANPNHPEGTLFALVLASLFTPLIDHFVVAWYARTVRRRYG